MRLSASYNFFNAEEHLKASVASIRPAVDHVSIVYQKISNAGDPISAEALSSIEELSARGLIDEAIEYQPRARVPRRRNELIKRRIGLDIARKAGCTHFFSIDADEFYRAREITYAKRVIEEGEFNSTSVGSFMHIKRPLYRALDTTNCAFITKINCTTQIGVKRYPVASVDSTRRARVWPRRHRHFDTNEVAMYHMNLVRRDFASKFRNTSTSNCEFLDAVRAEIRSWSFGRPFDFGAKGLFDVFEAENEFNTWDCGSDPPA